MVRAGQLLATLDGDHLAAAYPSHSRISVSITGNGTLSGLLAPLTA